MFKLIIKLISDLIGPVNLKKSLMKQNGPSAHYGHFFDSLHQLWGALAAIIIHPHSWYEEIIFSFELCDHTYQVKSCNRFL